MGTTTSCLFGDQWNYLQSLRYHEEQLSLQSILRAWDAAPCNLRKGCLQIKLIAEALLQAQHLGFLLIAAA